MQIDAHQIRLPCNLHIMDWKLHHVKRANLNDNNEASFTLKAIWGKKHPQDVVLSYTLVSDLSYIHETSSQGKIPSKGG
ncbi:hypothetical protein IMY05_006G0106100 [Salix suchowensis]|nr:hypothetical protein IMY05_006G0106100 [Salix suchowensis]